MGDGPAPRPKHSIPISDRPYLDTHLAQNASTKQCTVLQNITDVVCLLGC